MSKATWIVAALGFGAAGFVGGFGYGRWYGKASSTGRAERKVLYWVDPMHPAYKSDKPGIAPDCGMELVPFYEDGQMGAEPTVTKAHAKVLYYRDPKQPDFRSDKPGLNPETGNELEPVYDLPAPGSVTLSDEKQRWIGIQTVAAELTPVESVVRANGRVAVDETRITTVNSRTEGWIEKVFVDFVGRAVRMGEPMVTVYSPEMAASQQEYLLALKAKETMSHSTIPGMSHNSEPMVTAARQRLEHWGLDAASIAQLEKSGQPVRNITIFAPSSGTVTERKAFPNMKVTPEMPLYVLTDLAKVWIEADVFESDASQIRMGQTAVVTLTHEPGRKLRGKVANILPQVDPQTRTLKVRLEMANPEGLLKPDMYLNVEFASAASSKLTVPSEAVLDSGARQVVFVALGDGVFEPRGVKLGERFDDRVEILAGIKTGEKVVAAGAFLLDSESQLRGGTTGRPQ